MSLFWGATGWLLLIGLTFSLFADWPLIWAPWLRERRARAFRAKYREGWRHGWARGIDEARRVATYREALEPQAMPRSCPECGAEPETRCDLLHPHDGPGWSFVLDNTPRAHE